jgi:hypothetical protein
VHHLGKVKGPEEKRNTDGVIKGWGDEIMKDGEIGRWG